MIRIEAIFDVAFALADIEAKQGISDDSAFRELAVEVGELGRAMSHESGEKRKDDVKESSIGEAFDVMFNAMGMFKRRGGTKEMLSALLADKGGKWASHLDVPTAQWVELLAAVNGEPAPSLKLIE